MKKRDYIDESFQLGSMKVSRRGKEISIENEGQSNANEKIIKELANEYDEMINNVNKLVEDIRELVSKCNPLEILEYAYIDFTSSLTGITSEFQLSMENIHRGKELEYIQSVLVSTENKYIKNENNDDVEEIKKFEMIADKINELYTIMQFYFLYHTAKMRENNVEEFNEEEEKFLMESQSNMFFRGDRYPVYEIPHLNELLEVHSDEFEKLYGITTDDFINGLSNIQKSLTRINLGEMFEEENKAFSQMLELYMKYEEFKNGELSINESYTEEELIKKFRENSKLDLEKVQLELNSQEKNGKKEYEKKEYEKFDLQKLTNWPIELLEDLSFRIGEDDSFYSSNEYAGWPLIELPVFKKPFIKIDGKYYCFDYYSLFDNIYRVIQKLFRGKDSAYADLWISRQNEVTEKIVDDLFKKVLPGCKTYISNYYPKNGSLKQCAENDLLVIYDDNLIIVEVKAGSYTYRAPIVDIESHINSLKTLVEKADGQAGRTLEYLKSSDIVKLYNKDKSEKCEISLNNFNEVTLMCVTLDNFNEFCSKIEKLKFLQINKNTIALSIDDFRIYTDYFESPLIFLHYLKQRKLATQNKALYLNDELDHLGMYIENNIYSKMYENKENSHLFALGYRERLDEYFGSLINSEFEVEKPIQSFPKEFNDIINLLDVSDLNEKSRLANFLLDFSSDEKNQFADGINQAITRGKEINRVIPLGLRAIPICVFCHQPDIEDMPEKLTSDYTKSTMLELHDDYRVELNLFYGDKMNLNDVKFKFYEPSNIKTEELEAMMQMGEKFALSRIETYKKRNNIKKIGRNDLCPCGSGKKYKNCHDK
ncbi:hypothetical protein D2A34_05170 [Clostridium chromiireducens]|uniref:Preprotein translocase subunit SecA n=1 Tax=Clostridium chromiireducens TaxID=225345 RepID=A0A399IUR9_9CLOT|nr:SEC-C metal-binding domain-containing protein [Clostridium chromiireducens]RII36774.1 hypothetical protein D2A34_05170 [Clostridium chromiireducens]